MTPRFPILANGNFIAGLSWPQVATSDPKQIAAWEAQYPGCLWGMPTGKAVPNHPNASGIDVLDFDLFKDGKPCCPELRRFWNLWEPKLLEYGTKMVRTKSGGVHVFFKAGNFAKYSGKGGPLGIQGLDLIANRGFVHLHELRGFDVVNPYIVQPWHAELSKLVCRHDDKRISKRGVDPFGCIHLAPWDSERTELYIKLLEQLPNSETDWHCYTRLRYACIGIIRGGFSSGTVSQDQADRLRNAFLSWVSRWEGGWANLTREKAQWERGMLDEPRSGSGTFEHMIRNIRRDRPLFERND